MLIEILYSLVILFLGIYIFRITGLSIHARIHEQKSIAMPAKVDLPVLTIQLPVYNEKDVVERLIDAVCMLNYPHDRLQIQVLDDSTDVTTSLIEQYVAKWRKKGVIIEHVRRSDRRGHKAGNLVNALPLSKGEFIAIFDADFLPEPEWLLHTMAHFFQPGGEHLGLVQTRWKHLNSNDSALTYAQNLAVDQFAIAQSSRVHMNLWSSFYGSAGVWRKACIVEAGGWASVISEDLDLAYRAQLCGWKIGYDSRVLAAAELPPSMLAYKQQQYFWSKGNIQVVRILWERMKNAAVSSPLQWIDALLFATWPVNYMLLTALSFVQLLTLFFPVTHIEYLDFMALCVVSASILPPIIDSLMGRLQFPIHLWLMVGISINITDGLFSGMFSPIREEPRGTTPRSASANKLHVRTSPLIRTTIIELFFWGFSLFGCLIAYQQERWWLLLLLVNFVMGYGWVGMQSAFELFQSYSHRQISNVE